MKTSEEPTSRGLSAIQEGRKRRAEFPRIPPRFFLWMFVILAGWAIIYWKIDQNELESWRNRLLSRQRAVDAELGPRYNPVRDQLEVWIMEAAGPYAGDSISAEAKSSPFRSKPGTYLRLYIDDAKQQESLRRAALESLRDGFTSCFTTFPNPDPFKGPACKKNQECPPGQHCNEVFHCSEPAQPYNLRVAYRAARVLSDSWVNDVREASNDMRLRLLERDFDSALQEDIPLAIDLLVRAQYFLLVLDENTDLAATEVPDAGTYSESLQAVPHPVRVFAWDLVSKKLLFRVRTEIVSKVGITTDSATTRIAVQRQSNNCAIAVEVRRLLGDESAGAPSP